MSIIGLVGISNVPRLTHDILQLWSISEQIDRRFDQVRMAREEGLAEILLESLQIEPKVIYTKELASHPHYQTRELADFLGYRGMILVGERL